MQPAVPSETSRLKKEGSLAAIRIRRYNDGLAQESVIYFSGKKSPKSKNTMYDYLLSLLFLRQGLSVTQASNPLASNLQSWKHTCTQVGCNSFKKNIKLRLGSGSASDILDI